MIRKESMVSDIYESYKDEWEKLYYEKIIAIDIDENALAAVGEDVGKVGLEARNRRPAHRIFMRKVGKDPSVVRLRNRHYV